MNYSDFKKLTSSNKITLCILEGVKRIITSTVHSGAIYKYPNTLIVSSVKSNGELLTLANSIAEVDRSSYYADSSFIYVTNPNADYVVVTNKYFFSDTGLSLPFDLQAGEEVYFEPIIKKTSQFNQELDIVNENLSAIEGSGTISFINDSSFWKDKFDKVHWENQSCSIYSWSRELDVAEAKTLFKGYVSSKSFADLEVTFSLKDVLAQLRSTISLDNISELEGRTDPSLATAKQRLVYGPVKGFKPINTDKLISKSYPISGTVSVFTNSTSVVGTDTSFLSQLVAKDKLVVKGVEYTVAKVVNDNVVELANTYVNVTEGNIIIEVIPSVNKSYINRTWFVASHPLNTPVKTIEHGSTTQRLVLNNTNDLYDGDYLYIGVLGSGECGYPEISTGALLSLPALVKFQNSFQTLLEFSFQSKSAVFPRCNIVSTFQSSSQRPPNHGTALRLNTRLSAAS